MKWYLISATFGTPPTPNLYWVEAISFEEAVHALMQYVGNGALLYHVCTTASPAYQRPRPPVYLINGSIIT